MSVILRTRLSPIITLLAGVAVAEAIRHSVGARTELKWPNDVVVRSNGRAGTGHRKLAGILAEALPAEHGPVGLVLGIGVNLGAGPFPDELHDTAIALETVVGRPVSRGDIGAEVLVRLDTWRKRLAESGPAPIVDRWRQLSPLSHGATVSWDASPARRRGRTAGVDENGALLVECDGGHERIVGGELVWES